MTFNCDFDKLNSALSGHESIEGTTSILSEKEREKLFELSCIVRKSNTMVQQGEHIPADDEKEICEAILGPAATISGDDMPGDFAMDLIGWHGQVHYAVRWCDTIPAYWADNLKGRDLC
jgi:hypothetical protein